VSHADEGTLHAYLDGELAPGERTRLEAHVAECAPCRDRLTEERGLIERAGHLLALAELPPGHTHRAAPLTGGVRRARPRFMVPGVWAASIAAAFLAGWLLRPRPQFRAVFGANDTTVAEAPAAQYPPSATIPDSVQTLARRAPVTHRRDARPAFSDSSAALAQSNADARADSPSVSAPAPAPAPARQAVAPEEAAGKVAGPALRGAAPTPIPPATVAVAPSAAPQFERLEVASRAANRPIGTTWTVIAPEPARKALGTDLARIPGLPVRDILQNPLAPGQVVVEQEVAEGTVIQLLQSVQGDSVMRAYATGGSPLQKTVGRLQVRISGPLAADSLLKLLELVR